MKRMIRKICRKLNTSSGMSLGELLAATLILLLATSILTAVASLAYNQYEKSIRGSEAQVLCSTIRNVISEELAYTTDIKTDSATGQVLYFQSSKGYKESTFTSTGGDSGGYGYIIIQNYEKNDEFVSILGKGAYSRGLLASVTGLSYNAADYSFTVKLSIGYDGTEYYQQEFQVLNVNHVEPTH